MMRIAPRPIAILLAGFLTLAVGRMASRAEEKPKPADRVVPEFPVESIAFFESKVLPLLQSRCFECHGPDAKEPKGGLRLDSRDWVLKGGDSGPAVVPGKSAESLLIDSINYRSFEMPPRTRLPAGEIAILTRWVELGAPWSKGGSSRVVESAAFPLQQRKADHWAWHPIRSTEPPAVPQTEWNQTIVDRFIRSRLNEKKLEPAPPADRRTLIRRASFALIGLPPTLEQVNAFLADSRSTDEAFAAVVDELLASPHFGERWGRHWLDLARYAETLGHEFDYPLHFASQYRDYVIRALNADVPYDQFVREQIAGDLLSAPRRHPTEGYNESLIGTGFWCFGEDKHAPVDARGEEAAKIDNQIDVFSKTFLGMTVACARCHDHKFDAISQKDYYALSGYLKSSRRQIGYLDPGGRIATAADALEKLSASGSQRLQDAATSAGDRPVEFAADLLAAREALWGTPKPSDRTADQGDAREDILFEDFERDEWGERWIAEGPAFDAGPAEGTLPNQQAVSGFRGKRLVNSYLNGDGSLGRLTSKAFVVERRNIRLLIGGGAHAGKTCVNLIVDGKVVRTATGKDNEKLEPAGWDVSDLQGELAILQIVDQHRGGWGHVNVDQIEFTDGATTLATRRPIAAVAAEMKRDPGRLARWTEALQRDAAAKPDHPLSTWVALAASGDDKEFLARKADWNSRLKKESEAASSRKSGDLFEDFNAGHFNDWFVTGRAFGGRPTAALDWNPAPETDPIAPAGVAHSGWLSPRLTGVLRSKTFVLKHPQILYRAAGKNAQIRLIIDGYQMDVFNGLLFRGASIRVDNDQFQWITQAGDVSRYQGHRCHIELIDDGDGWLAIDEIRFGDGTPPSAMPDPLAARLAEDATIDSLPKLANAYQAAFERSQNESAKPAAASLSNAALPRWLLEAGLVGSAESNAALARQRQEWTTLADSVPAPMRVLAITDGTGEDEHLFIRGSHRNLGPLVPRRMLEAISGDSQKPAPARGSGRLELADRLLDPHNPLPSRVIVNRVWHHLFGSGIVPSVDNFGVLGESPTHPELLDRLSDDFMKDGWSLKRLIRRLMLTKTWQMSSRSEEAAETADPMNRQWHRMNVHRLEGEAIRDALLRISGRFDSRVYGPSVPVHLTPFMQGRGRPAGGPLDGDGRRSVYTSVNRNFLPPMMLAFDTPIPFTTIGRRNVSNVPAQALILMNDPFVQQQTQLWAKRILSLEGLTPERRIERLSLDAYSRPPTDSERDAAIAFLKAQAAALGLPEAQAFSDERPWADLCHVLVNVKEFLFVP